MTASCAQGSMNPDQQPPSKARPSCCVPLWWVSVPRNPQKSLTVLTEKLQTSSPSTGLPPTGVGLLCWQRVVTTLAFGYQELPLSCAGWPSCNLGGNRIAPDNYQELPPPATAQHLQSSESGQQLTLHTPPSESKAKQGTALSATACRQAR